MAEHKKWIPLESNPEVLNEFAAKLGLDSPAYGFCDVFGLDEELLAMVPQPTLAVILLFPVGVDDEDLKQSTGSGTASDAASVYFMRQTIGNACGTIAVLHSIQNNLDRLHVADGSFLQRFHESTLHMSAEERGRFLEFPPEGAPNIEEAHQAAAAEGDTAAPSADEDVNLHFIAFVEREGQLYELDGRRSTPIDHGPTTPASLLKDSVKVIKEFIERTNSLQFNVIALAGNS